MELMYKNKKYLHLLQIFTFDHELHIKIHQHQHFLIIADVLL